MYQPCISNNISTFFVVEERDRRIASGEISIGRAICPLTVQRFKNGQIEEYEVFGRVIPMDVIRQTHLRQMAKLGILRKTDVNGMTAEECRSLLRKRGGKGLAPNWICT
mgnify:FL=1